MNYGPDNLDFAAIFNNGVLCFAIAHADELGILDGLNSYGEYHFDPLTEPVKRQIGILLTAAGITRGDPDRGQLYPTQHIERLLEVKGFFVWLFQASGEVLARGLRGLDFVTPADLGVWRSGEAVAAASSDFGRRLIDPVLLRAAEIGSAQGIIDLGCGDGTRLISLCSHFRVRGLGIDISEAALDRGRDEVRAAGLNDSVLLRLGDVRYVDNLPPGYTSFLMCLMGHDLWPEDACRDVLQRLRSASPDIESLVLVETVQAERVNGLRLDVGIPSIGYEYLHSLMQQQIPSEADWDRVLASAGWIVRRKERLVLPANTIIFFCNGAAAG